MQVRDGTDQSQVCREIGRGTIQHQDSTLTAADTSVFRINNINTVEKLNSSLKSREGDVESQLNQSDVKYDNMDAGHFRYHLNTFHVFQSLIAVIKLLPVNVCVAYLELYLNITEERGHMEKKSFEFSVKVTWICRLTLGCGAIYSFLLP